ncbi:MAG TPA: 16S rRNA (adenine(1518)-N(6)/adenine(1519)-N(6))-dimethyltransferase RsmA [Polyangiaceae bacterium]|nr:16S rRNA (adenine(1518)-N(6)/adenine(1519)-N(6))-dimethyltransferase RsmA [Polyangiaceae bacterium]
MSEPNTNGATRRPSQRELLRRYGLQPKHSFGQNFLQDEHALEELARLIAEDMQGAIEIGAGLGALTGKLLGRSLQVIAIERDRELIPVLRQEFQDALAAGQLHLLEADAKTADYHELLVRLPRPLTLAGNLPYQLTGPLLRETCKLAPRIQRAVFLVQLEVAQRLVAQPASAAYGALSVFVQAAFAVRRPLVVKRGCFVPEPKVDSAVVVLTPHPNPIAEETAAFVELVRRAFQQRRKTLRNAWAGALGTNAAQLQERAARASIDLSLRGETLSVLDFARMAREMDTP